jgi:hypothetical protein
VPRELCHIERGTLQFEFGDPGLPKLDVAGARIQASPSAVAPLRDGIVAKTILIFL